MFSWIYWPDIYYHNFISWYLKDIDPILPNSHFMFLDRYWSHISKFPFQVFWKRLIPDSRFSKILHGSSRLFGPHLFHKLQKDRCSICCDSQNLFVGNYPECFLHCLKYLGVSKDKHNWFGGAWTRPPSPKIIKIMTFRVFPKLNRKVTNPKWGGIIVRSFRPLFS